jgi:hypothetical protein
MMSDLVTVTADALLPFLAAGGAAVGAGAANQAGSDLYKSATAVLGKIRNRLRGAGKADLEAAIREALADGSVTIQELEGLRTAYVLSQEHASGVVVGNVSAETSFVGHTEIKTLNIGRRK